MPIYEYVCHKCQNKFELMRPFSKSGEPAACPACKGSSERVMSRFACFTTGASGASMPVAGGGGCAGCSSSSCATCNN